MNAYKQMTGRILISISVVLTAGISTLVDLLPGDIGHVFNPTWPPHAIFHDIAMFLLLDQVALLALWLLWRRSSEPQIAVRFATLLVIVFWTPFYYITTLFPMASLAANLQEMDKVSVLVGGVRLYFNVLIGTAMIVIALIGYWVYGRSDARSGSQD